MKISDLAFDPKNARKRTERSYRMLQESLEQVGAARSIVIDEDGTILAGNGTVEAAGLVGIERVKVIDASGDEIIAVRRKGLTKEQKTKLALFDNRTGELAEWDVENLVALQLEGADLSDFWREDELEDLLDAVLEPEWTEGDTTRLDKAKSDAYLRPVLSVADVAALEKALALTGNANRAEALMVIVRAFIGEGDGVLPV